MARMEWLAVSACVYMLAGCAQRALPAESVTAPKDTGQFFMGPAFVPDIPPPTMDFSVASCYLWNPHIQDGNAFYMVVLQEGRLTTHRMALKDPQTKTIFIHLFMARGIRIKDSFNGVTGWVAVCKDGESPKQGSRYASL